MKLEYTFNSPRLRFRTLQVEDAELIVSWRSDPNVYRYFKNPHATSLTEHMQWFEKYTTDSDRYDFVIIHKENDVPIGFLSLSGLNDVAKGCEVGYAIAEPAYVKKGFAKEAVSALMSFGAKTFAIEKYCAVIHKDNEASIRLISSLGFNLEFPYEFGVYTKAILS